MSNDFTTPVTTDEATTDHIPGIDHPTTTVDVTYPDGATEEVEPEYDIITMCDPETELGVGLRETRVTRLELSEATAASFDKHHIQQDLGTAHGEFEAEYGYPNAAVCVELAYFRVIDGEKTLCVQLRGEEGDQHHLSQFALHVDEWLRTER